MSYIGHKYGSARDEVLHAMSVQGWANASNGDVESPTGFFAIVTIAQTELAEIVAAFSEDIERTEDDTFDPAELVGNYIVYEDSQGLVSVESFSVQGDITRGQRAWAAYRDLESAYSVWSDATEDDTL